MQAFVVWVSTHDFMQSQIEAEDVAQSGIVDCFDLAQELLSSTALLQPFLEEWTGPLPQGFSAIAAAKGIALKQPLSLAPALLQAMRQNLRHTSLSAALQAMKAGYKLALAAPCSAAPQVPQRLQASLPQGPQLGAIQPNALQPYQQAVLQDTIMSDPACSDLGRAVGPKADASTAMQGIPGSTTAGAAVSSGSRPSGHAGALNASNKSAESDKENAPAVNPKRIQKSKAAAAAEADRESKRSKAVSADQALAAAKAAALASGWDSNDDFETLPKR
ncbi:hypothetical protein WJX82_010153 [Trebouxia sp. C0006]